MDAIDYPIKRNVAISLMVGSYQLAMMFVLPQLLAQSWWWLLTLVPFLWSVNILWALIHEAIHKIYHPDRAINEWAGRVLSIVLGPSYQVLRFGHLMHHKLNRQWESEYVGVDVPQWKAMLEYYYNLLGGLYITEMYVSVVSSLASSTTVMWLVRRYFRSKPLAVEAIQRYFFDKGHIREVRIDTWGSMLLHGAAIGMAGAYWPVIVALFIMRAFAISFMDNIYHYNTSEDNSVPARELYLPPILSLLILHGNYHHTHHKSPSTPWHLLPALHKRVVSHFAGPFVHGLRDQFNGPIRKYEH